MSDDNDEAVNNNKTYWIKMTKGGVPQEQADKIVNDLYNDQKRKAEKEAKAKAKANSYRGMFEKWAKSRFAALLTFISGLLVILGTAITLKYEQILAWFLQ
jgi:hypothetical protein